MIQNLSQKSLRNRKNSFKKIFHIFSLIDVYERRKSNYLLGLSSVIETKTSLMFESLVETLMFVPQTHFWNGAKIVDSGSAEKKEIV